MNIGDNIKKTRLGKNMTQDELAKRSHISRVSLGNYERGARIPNAKTLQSLAASLDVTANDLLANTNQLFQGDINDHINNPEEINWPEVSSDEYDELAEESKIEKFLELIHLTNYSIDELNNDTIRRLYKNTMEFLEFEFYKLKKHNLKIPNENDCK